MECKFCGFTSDIEDFEEDYTNHKGVWCPMCDGFTYCDEISEKHNFKLILETKLTGTKKNRKLPFPTQVSPLRWPGGKSKFVGQILDRCEEEKMKNFVEPFAGGASVGLSLLMAGKIKELYLNDLDFGVYSLFEVIKNFPRMLIDRIETFEPSLEAYKMSQNIIKDGYNHLDMIDAAWNLLVVNRLAFSGIAKANCMSNPSARWNKKTLIKRINKIHDIAAHIHVYCMDACEFIEEMYWKPNTTIFIDPPYKIKGKSLYMKYYKDNDHENLAFLLEDLYKGVPGADMLLTYDDCEYIRELYQFPDVENVSRTYSIAN